MIIRRLRVEEGFFDGLDIEFSDGLNVLIGGRGVGKTGIIELLRFGLGVGGLTNNSADESMTHALAILQGGQVYVDLEMGEQKVSVTRSASDVGPRSESNFTKPIIFSQTEIESVGLDASGRMSLIDNFKDGLTSDDGSVAEINSKISSLAALITDLRKDLIELAERTSKIQELQDAEKKLDVEQKNLSKKNKQVDLIQKQLTNLQNEIGKISVDSTNVVEVEKELKKWRQNVLAASYKGKTPEFSNAEVAKQFDEIRKGLQTDRLALQQVLQNADSYLIRLGAASDKLQSARTPLEDKARDLRITVEKHNEGAGKVSRDLGKIRESLAQIDNLLKLSKAKEKELGAAFSEVIVLSERAEGLQMLKFERRKEVASELNDRLGPTIQVKINHFARLDEYEAALKDVLRGSGLKYNEIAPAVVSRMSPQELFVTAHYRSYEEFSETIDIPIDRSTRLISYLHENDMGSILSSKIEDDVELMLHDGADYKPIDGLSIGQRCTISLSIVMENRSRALLVDQPEDHLDNEFIAKTLIQALKQRSGVAQSIVTSHNANIPVLGDAETVFQLESNGRRGFIKCSGALMSEEMVNAIETIMEGGHDAFEHRSKFYSDNWLG